MFVTKANADEGGIMKAACLFHQCNQSVRMTYGVTVTSLCNSLQHKTSVTKYHVCQIALNQTLLHKLKKWCKFSSRIEAKSLKKRPACTEICILYIIVINNTLQIICLEKLVSKYSEKYIAKWSGLWRDWSSLVKRN